MMVREAARERNRRITAWGALVVCTALVPWALLTSACGARGAPIPPLPKGPAPVRGLMLRQSGGELELTWRRPERRQDGEPIEGPLVYRVLARVLDRPAAPTLPPSQPAPGAAPPGAPSGVVAPSQPGGTAPSGAGGDPTGVTAPGTTASTAAGAPSDAPALGQTAATAPSAGAGAPTGPTAAGRPEGPPSREDEDAFLRGAATVARMEDTGSPGPDAPPLRARIGSAELAGVKLESARVQLAVIAVDQRGRRSRPGAILAIDPIAPLPPPTDFKAVPAREGIKLSWTSAPAASPAAVNVYRTRIGGERERTTLPSEEPEREPAAGTTPPPRGESEREQATPAASAAPAAPAAGPSQAPGAGPGVPRLVEGSPFAGTEGLDAGARIGETYRYEARTVATTPGKGTRESEPTPEVIVAYADRFPPSPPGLVTAHVIVPGAPEEGAEPEEEGAPPPAAGAGAASVRISWSPPLDEEVAGYRIYRALGDGPFELVGQAGTAESVWTDAAVAPGARYRYALSTIDAADPPNESERSEVVEAEVPGGS